MPLTVLKTQRRVKDSDKAQFPFKGARQGNCRENTRWRWIETEKSHISFIIKMLSDYIKLSNVPNSSSSFIHHFCFHMLLSHMSILFSLTSLHFSHPSHRFLLFFQLFSLLKRDSIPVSIAFSWSTPSTLEVQV